MTPTLLYYFLFYYQHLSAYGCLARHGLGHGVFGLFISKNWGKKPAKKLFLGWDRALRGYSFDMIPVGQALYGLPDVGSLPTILIQYIFPGHLYSFMSVISIYCVHLGPHPQTYSWHM